MDLCGPGRAWAEFVLVSAALVSRGCFCNAVMNLWVP